MRGKPAVLLALLLLGPAEAGHYRTAAQQAPSADDRAAMLRAIDAKRDMPDDEEKTGGARIETRMRARLADRP